MKLPAHFCKLLVNLTFWKTEYLIAQLRTGIWRKVIRHKTCPQGVLQAQEEKSRYFIFTTFLWACLAENLLLFKRKSLSEKIETIFDIVKWSWKFKFSHIYHLCLPPFQTWSPLGKNQFNFLYIPKTDIPQPNSC